jgi:hypothetical protein
MSSAKFPKNVICKIHLQNFPKPELQNFPICKIRPRLHLQIFQIPNRESPSAKLGVAVFLLSAKSRVATGDSKRINFRFPYQDLARFILQSSISPCFSYFLYNPKGLRESNSPTDNM